MCVATWFTRCSTRILCGSGDDAGRLRLKIHKIALADGIVACVGIMGDKGANGG